MTVFALPQTRCRFGIACGDVTPPVGIYHRMWGAARHDRATGVHRPLRATAMCFQSADETEDHGTSHVWISLDHCLLGKEELQRLLDAVERQTGILASRVHVVCTHTHAAGLLSLDRSGLPGGELIAGYLQDLANICAQLVEQASDSSEVAHINYAYGHCSLAAHRDFWDGTGGRFVCGFNPGQSADDTMLVVNVERENGQRRATIVNYACHPTSLAWDNTLISPDYPGAMRETMEAQTGAPAVFLQGASGELGPRVGYVGDVAVADQHGRQLGYAALGVLEGLPRAGTQFEYQGAVESGATLGTWSDQPVGDALRREAQRMRGWQGLLELPYRTDLVPTDRIQEQFQEAQAAEQQGLQQGDLDAARWQRALAERKRRELARRATLPEGPCFHWRVALWRWGQAIWMCVQGEPYSYLQTTLRREFPGTPIVVAAVAYDWSLGYLPTADCFGKDLYQQNIAVIAPGAFESGVEQIAAQIRELLA